jgi:hypothetical protein
MMNEVNNDRPKRVRRKRARYPDIGDRYDPSNKVYQALMLEHGVKLAEEEQARNHKRLEYTLNMTPQECKKFMVDHYMNQLTLSTTRLDEAKEKLEELLS